MPAPALPPHKLAGLTGLLLDAVKNLAASQLSAGAADSLDDSATGAAADSAADLAEDDAASTVNITAHLHSSTAPELVRFLVGDVINSRYQVLHILGRGSMGVVYRVRDQLFPGRRVALKTMQRVADAEWLALFRAEFRALAELRHAHIAEVYDFEELAGQAGHLFTMEFVDGQELDVAMRSRDVGMVWRAVTEMAEALAYVHSHGRLHLDIKPQNAIVAPDGTCKLLDFGLVGLVFMPGQFAGTPLYMAPEILKDQVPDARCDLFSLGITAYQLLTGSVPYSRTTRIRDLFSEKLERAVEFPAELCESIPSYMRQAVRKLCALRPEDRFASAQEFLDATRGEAGSHGVLAVRPARRLSRSAFIGRQHELNQLLDYSHTWLTGQDSLHRASLCCIGAPSGLGKSRLLAEARVRLQSEGPVVLQGDAYDHDVGEYTALSPILLAASHLAHAQDAAPLIQKYGPEIVKIVPAFGLPIICQPSPPFSNGEAERARLIEQTAAFLIELAQRRPIALFLNDLQWASAGTMDVLHQVLKQLRVHPEARLALTISYRSDEVKGQPIEKLLFELPEAEYTLVRLQGLSAEQVGALMSSMLLASVSQEIASQMQQAASGVPFFVEESTRWLLSQGALVVRGGACVVNTDSGQLDLHVEVGKGIVARAATHGKDALLCLQLLAVCARPIELEHLRGAMSEMAVPIKKDAPEPPELERVLAALEAEQFIAAVAGNRPQYALAHDRIRESLFYSLSADERQKLHGQLGAAFETFLLATQGAELAVLAAVHLNATSAPMDLAARTSRCEVNLRAAEVARQAADFTHAQIFLDAAEALLFPDIFADHERGMRLTYQRALTFGAMLRHNECVKFAKLAILHACDLVEEGKALVLAIRGLTVLTRYDEAIDAGVDFCNRLDPQAKLPKHPGLLSVASDVLSISRQVRSVGVDALLARIFEPEDPQRDLLYEMITAIGDAVYIARPMLFSKLVRQGIHRLIHEGASVSCRGSAVFVVLLAAISLGAAGRVELAIAVSKAARRLIDSVPFEIKCRILFGVENFLRHFDEPLAVSPPLFLTTAAHAKQAHDTAYEGYALVLRTLAFDVLGEPLDHLNDAYQKLASEPAVKSSQELRDWLHIGQSLRAALQGQPAPVEPTFVEPVRSNTSSAFRNVVKLRGAAFGLWPGPFRAAEYGFPALLNLTLGAGGVFTECIAQFHAGIFYLARLRDKLPILDRLHFRAAAEFVIYNIRTRARYNPADYAHRIHLLDAEHLRNRGKLQRALPLYENAARLAKENGWPNEAALAFEKLAEVFIALGDKLRGQAALEQSIALYKHWQAWAKVEKLTR